MPQFPNRTAQILEVFENEGAGTVDQLARRVIQRGVYPPEELNHGSFQWVKGQCAAALKIHDRQGLPVAIITPHREGRAHIWVQLRFATLDDCKYKLARDIAACEHDYKALFPLRDFIEEKFHENLSFPMLNLMPGQDNWWKPLLDIYDHPDDEDNNPNGYTEDPEDDQG